LTSQNYLPAKGPHCRRVNYRAVQFKNAHLNYPDTPHHRGHGWIATNETESIN